MWGSRYKEKRAPRGREGPAQCPAALTCVRGDRFSEAPLTSRGAGPCSPRSIESAKHLCHPATICAACSKDLIPTAGSRGCSKVKKTVRTPQKTSAPRRSVPPSPVPVSLWSGRTQSRVPTLPPWTWHCTLLSHLHAVRRHQDVDAAPRNKSRRPRRGQLRVWARWTGQRAATGRKPSEGLICHPGATRALRPLRGQREPRRRGRLGEGRQAEKDPENDPGPLLPQAWFGGNQVKCK